MNKTEFGHVLAEKLELSKSEGVKIIDTVLDTIKEELVKGEKIVFTGFGNFEVRERAARNGVNPQTGESIEIAATKSPAFKPGKPLKDAVKQG